LTRHTKPAQNALDTQSVSPTGKHRSGRRRGGGPSPKTGDAADCQKWDADLKEVISQRTGEEKVEPKKTNQTNNHA